MQQSCRRVPALIVMIAAGCQSGSQDLDAALRGRANFLDDTASWSVAGPVGTCFGAAVAVGDLDGDGRPELIVGDPPCLPLPPPDAGRIAIYRGGDDYFATTPTITALDWQNPARGGFQMRISAADVDGDGHADLVVRAQAGVQVFTAIADVGAPLGPPSFRVPGTGSFGGSAVTDVDGDGLADLVSLKAGVATVWRATPGAQPFTATRAIAGASTVLSAGDTDGDGRGDVILALGESFQLLRGCAIGAPTCEGGLAVAPTWTIDRRVYGMVPDLNGDGLSEALVGDGLFGPAGRVALHLSAPDGLASTPSWTTLADPNYPVLGQSVAVPGDLDGDHRATEFLVAAAGRVYAFFPPHRLSRMAPQFAWPRLNGAQAQRLGDGDVLSFGGISLATPGDLDGDHRSDLVLGNAPEFGSGEPGHVYVYRGGKVRPHTPVTPRPYLPGARVCQPEGDGRPDLTVDGAALARSLYVESREFPADSCEIAEGCVAGPGVRRLLRFTTSIANLGGSPLIIPGPETAPHLYHYDACHDHHHLDSFAAYELRRGSSTVAVGRKQGFFLVDVAPYCSNDHASGDFFPDQGISAGWADIYEASLPCQWLDVTDVPDGRYTLRVGADTLHLVDQDDRLPDTAEVDLVLSGDRVRVVD
jgi:hypothetical protein